MLFSDEYKTIAKKSTGIYREKGSKFIAYAIPIRLEQEVKAHLQQIRAENPKARHHCWAWRLSSDRTVFKLNDDGEPAGTAGRPILNTLLSYDVTNLLVIVVRYFGGTLLGVPGLINAYKCATQDALEQNNLITKTVNDIYLIQFDYLSLNQVMRIVKEEQLTVINQQFDNSCAITLEIKQSQVNQAITRLEKIANLKAVFQQTI